MMPNRAGRWHGGQPAHAPCRAARRAPVPDEVLIKAEGDRRERSTPLSADAAESFCLSRDRTLIMGLPIKG
jgi:hypothetical protein